MIKQVRVPIMVGITGKRDLAGKDEIVRRELHASFVLLDRQLPHSPKILLSGLAAGADSIAAEVAKEIGWRVIVILPFSLGLFAQDFDAESLKRLRAFVDTSTGALTDPTTGRVITLPPLLKPTGNDAFDQSALEKREGKENPDRDDHFEQVGQFIADRCAVLFAVMPANELPERVGGTARIVEYRLRGTFDGASENIADRSQVVRKPVDLDAPQVGPVCLLNIEPCNDLREQPLRLIQLWRPIWDEESASFSVEKLMSPLAKELADSMRLALRVDAFNRLADASDGERSQRKLEALALQDKQWRSDLGKRVHSGTEDAASTLEQMRQTLSVIQGAKKRALTRMVAALAYLFVFAVIAVEAHLQFEGLLPILSYIIFLFTILIIFGFARLRALQQFAEDYRAVSEALRVQIAWWDGGLVTRNNRVDRMYLCGTNGSLAMVRAAVRYLVDASLVERADPQPSLPSVTQWIDSQISYFEDRTRERRTALYRIEDIIWFLFFTSVGMGISLIPLTLALHDRNVIIDWIDKQANMSLASLVPWLISFVTALLIAGLLMVARSLASHSRKLHYGPARWTIESLNFLVGLAAGLLLSICIYVLALPTYAFVSAHIPSLARHAAECQTFDLTCAHLVGHKSVAGVAIVVAAIAGAVRFYAERLALEAEFHSYREALWTFKRARGRLNIVDGTSRNANCEFGKILFELGKNALKENEAWIRAHRVRPLEPHL